MTKTQLAVLKEVLDRALRRAKTSQNDGEGLWLHTWIISPLADVIGRSEGKVSEFNLRANNGLKLSGRICARSKQT